MSFYDNKIYQETDVETAKDYGRIPSFKALSFKENYGATGTGLNAKLGVIFKPFQALRVGAAIQTPNSYKISETYDNSFSYTYWEDGPKGASEVTNEAKSPDGSYDYIIRTPWRLTGSAAIIAGKKGFFSIDVDYIDYSKMAFQYQLEDKDIEIDINNEIKDTYIATTNFRFGAEFTKDIFRFRAGLGLVGLPVRVDNPDYFRDATKTYSLGLGLREKKFYFDVAYQFSRSSDDYRPYRVSSDYDQQIVARTQNNGQFIGTLGFKF
jgi:long-subunit fatty acid transport protein